MMIEIKSKEEFDKEIQESKLIVVDCFATWCGPCRQISPILEKWAEEMLNVKFLKVDVDQNNEIVRKYDIQSMPTFLFFKNGELVDRIVGANPNKLKQCIEKNKI